MFLLFTKIKLEVFPSIVLDFICLHQPVFLNEIPPNLPGYPFHQSRLKGLKPFITSFWLQTTQPNHHLLLAFHCRSLIDQKVNCASERSFNVSVCLFSFPLIKLNANIKLKYCGYTSSKLY